MAPRIPTLLRSLPAVLTLVGAVTVRAQLSSHSPFLPPQSNAPAAPAQNAPLEFGGYFVGPEGPMFRVKDATTKAGVFLKLNERDNGLRVVVKSHDPQSNTLTVEQDGRTLVLEERKSKIVSSGSAAAMPQPAMPMPANMPNVAPAVTQSVVVNPTPADEQKRLEAVAAEVARRRALREQAQQNMQANPMAQPQAAVPQVAPAPPPTAVRP